MAGACWSLSRRIESFLCCSFCYGHFSLARLRPLCRASTSSWQKVTTSTCSQRANNRSRNLLTRTRVLAVYLFSIIIYISKNNKGDFINPFPFGWLVLAVDQGHFIGKPTSQSIHLQVWKIPLNLLPYRVCSQSFHQEHGFLLLTPWEIRVIIQFGTETLGCPLVRQVQKV